MLFQPSSHLAQEEGVRAKSHTDVRCEEAAAAKRLRKVERADRAETTVGGGALVTGKTRGAGALRERPGALERAGGGGCVF